MKTLIFVGYLLILLCSGLLASCAYYEQYKTLQDYRRFVDYMDATNEPFEVASETDYYTIRLMEDKR